MRDDYANLKLDEYANNKSFAEDLTEGKFNFPIIHAIRYSLRIQKFIFFCFESYLSFDKDLSCSLTSEKQLRSKTCSTAQKIVRKKTALMWISPPDRNYPSDNRLMNILRQRTTDIEVKKYAISLLEDAGSFRYRYSH